MATPDPKRSRPPEDEANSAAAQPAPVRKAIRYGPTNAIIRRGQKRTPSGWVTPPAMLEPHKITDRVLTELVREYFENIGLVTKVLLDRYQGEPKVYITPTHHDDTEGIEVKRVKGKMYINLITALWEDDLLQPTNQKQRFDLEIVPAEKSPSGRSCLMLDLTKPRETGYIKKPTKKKNQGTDPQQ